MSEILRAGLLGVGNIGGIHLRSLSVMDDVDVTAVADVDADARERAREKTGCETYTDYKELLEDATVDFVVVSLPPFLHAEATIKAAEQGIHAFIEKPFSRTVEEGEQMVQAAADHDVTLGVDHTIRYQSDIRRMKQLYDEGRIGHVPIAYISRFNSGPFAEPSARAPVPEWQLDPEMTGGGVVFRLGVHLLDVLEWFFGEMTVEFAHLDGQLHSPAEDAAIVVLSTEGTNTMALLTCGTFQWESLPDVNMSFHLEGTTDHLENEMFLPDSLELHAAKSMMKNIAKRGQGKRAEVFKPTFYYQAHYNALEDFVQSLILDEQPPVSGQEGLRSIELAECIYDADGGKYGI